MKRSLGVTVIGILSMLGSLFMLLLGVLLAVAWKAQPHEAANPLAPVALKWATAFALVIIFAWAIWGISTSIGIFRLKNWARLSMLVFSVLLALFGFLFAIVMAAIPFPASQGRQIDPALMGHLRLAMVAYYLLMAAVGVWWLIFFNRKSVKQQFAGGVGASPDPDSSRPLSITVIACYCLVSAAFMVPMMFLHLPAVLFTFVLTGAAAPIVFLAYTAIFVYLGVGLWRLDPRARVVAIAFNLFVISNSLTFYLIPGYPSRMQRMMGAQPWPPTSSAPAVTTFVMWFSIATILAVVGPSLYFLITRKPAFSKPALLPT